MMEPEPN